MLSIRDLQRAAKKVASCGLTTDQLKAGAKTLRSSLLTAAELEAAFSRLAAGLSRP